MKLALALVCALTIGASTAAFAHHHHRSSDTHYIPGHEVTGHYEAPRHVDSYTRKDGTVVRGYDIRGGYDPTHYVPGHMSRPSHTHHHRF